MVRGLVSGALLSALSVTVQWFPLKDATAVFKAKVDIEF